MGDNTGKTVGIAGVPMDLGQGRRGIDMGPGAIRYAGLRERLSGLGYTVHDVGNVPVMLREQLADTHPHGMAGGGHAHHFEAVVSACEMIYQTATQQLAGDDVAIFLGGDHSLSIGSVGGMAANGNSLGVLWIDAHGDFNTPQTTPSGNIHGMPLAALTGLGPPELVNLGHAGPKVDPANVVLIGIRDLDPPERVALGDSAATVYTMREIDEQGIAPIAEQALKRLSRVDRLHISLDMDCLDPQFAPGVGTPVPGGLTYREAHLLMEMLSEGQKVRSLDVVEINPMLDHANQTANLAVELVASLLGQRIF